MSDLIIELTQIERTDISDIKNIVYGFKDLLDHNDFCNFDMNDWIEHIAQNEKFTFAIRARKSDDIKNYLVGICGLWKIDWVARHAKIIFAMVDKDGHKNTLQPHAASFAAFKRLLNQAFNILNLNKVWIEVLEENDIKPALEKTGFLVEGIRRFHIFKNGRRQHTIIFSLTSKEFIEEK